MYVCVFFFLTQKTLFFVGIYIYVFVHICTWCVGCVHTEMHSSVLQTTLNLA